MSVPERSNASSGDDHPVVPEPAAPRRYITDREVIDRGLVLELASDDHSPCWTRAELDQLLFDVEPALIGDALERLKAMEVVHLDGELVCAAKCARYMYAIGLVQP